MATKPDERGELFYVDENGKRRDAELHAEILGDDAPKEADRTKGGLPERPITPPKEPGKADKP